MLGTSDLDYTVTLVSSPMEYASTLSGPVIDIAVVGIHTGFCDIAQMLQSLAAHSIPVVLMVAPNEGTLAEAVEPYGVARRVEKTPSGYLTLPKVIRQVLDGSHDSVSTDGIPEELIHAVGGTTFAIPCQKAERTIVLKSYLTT